MNYFDFKYFHIAIGLIFLFNLMVSIYNPSKKIPKITLGILTVVLLGSGFSLLGRFGIPHHGPYPMWIWAKFASWLVLAIVPSILIKRAPVVAKKSSFVFLLIILIAAYMGVYKP